VVFLPKIPLFKDLKLLMAVPLLIILIAAWQGLGSFLGNYYLAKVSLGLRMTCGFSCSTNCWCCPTAISTPITPGI
jgi:hypothetical protein